MAMALGQRGMWLTRQDQGCSEAAVFAKHDVRVQAVADHADLLLLQFECRRDIVEHEIRGLANHNGFAFA